MDRESEIKLSLEEANETDLMDALMFSTDQELSDLKAILTANKWILSRICQLGFASALQCVLHFDLLDVNDKWNNWSPLQYACKSGHGDVVKHLLKWDAAIKQDVWREDSEFYLASCHGHMGIAIALYDKHKDWTEDSDVSYCLLYAACQGGHLPLVKMWLRPEHDINQLVQLVSSLDQCEYRYPLFAACQGGHLEVASFLIKDCGAHLTKDISENFVEFTTRLIKELTLVSSLKGELVFCLTKLDLEYPLAQWFCTQQPPVEPDPGTEESDSSENEIIILSVNNSLSELSAEVLWHLPGLIQLDVSKNPFLLIEEPLRPTELNMSRLVSLDVSHCELESVSSYLFVLPCLEDLNLSHNQLTKLGSAQAALSDDTKWKCKKLKILNLSHNHLTSLPHGLQGCPNMNSLNASHNEIESLCSPWACPLATLDLSHNQLSSFPANADSFWRSSLKHIYLQNNQLNELPATIVSIDSLRHLNASDNRIAKLPGGDRWRCRLFFLNLSNNEIGIGVRKASMSRVMSVKNIPPPNPSFYGAAMLRTLVELFLADNGLKSVPEGIEEMSNLSLLDLANNPEVTSLPWELGRLQKLLVFGLEGVTVKDKELQTLINSANDINNKNVSAREVIRYLESKRRRCSPSNVFKLVILGREKRTYEKTLLEQLANRKKKTEDITIIQAEEMLVQQMPLNLNNKQWQGQATVWEIPDKKFTPSVLPCFLTLNTLYLLQVEVFSKEPSDIGPCLKNLSEKMASIQACVFRPEFLVVLLYPESTTKYEVASVEEELSRRGRQQLAEYSGVKFFSLYGPQKNQQQQLDQLWKEVESACMKMSDAQFEKRRSLAYRAVPESFHEVWRKIEQAKATEGLNICTLENFLEITDCSCEDLVDYLEPEYTLEEFLLQNGSILRYSNINKELSNCVFLNPAWLFRILTKFLKSLTTSRSRVPRLPVREVARKAQELLPQDFDYVPAFLALLEAFNIGFRILDSSNEEILVIPSLLLKYPPIVELPDYPKGKKTARLYCLPAIPSALWSHVISQLILAFHRFSKTYWKLGVRDSGDGDSTKNNQSALKVTSGVERHKSFKNRRHQSMQGLQLSDKNIQYWRTGIFISHNQGYMVVEEVECSDKFDQKSPGILVTVQTNGSDFEEENLRKLAAIGIIKDELEEILEIFMPKFRDPSIPDLKPYVLCPYCHNIRPMSGSVKTDGLHFTTRDCAQVMLWKDIITCQGGPSSLQHLVPEMFFLELPQAMRLKYEDLELKTEERLGRGIAGEVLKGYYKGQEVAVKVFHRQYAPQSVPENLEPSPEEFDEAIYKNCQPENLSNEVTFISEDRIEAEQIKISNAFLEVRREVGILSKLQHPCVVTFVGVCVQPHLLLVMELAPLGSLRSELERRTAGTQSRHRDSAALSGNNTRLVSQMIFSKELTYKMILQIASGLSHLHSHQIIFRDLKPDNVLLMSLDENAPINVKLSDYGISKFATLQGTSGLFGTVGYMAPEVMSKQAYSQKVDIFSLGIVMGEVLTGIPPVDPEQPSKVSQIVNDGLSPSHMQGLKVQCNFPCLESLMRECWSPRSELRPEAADIVKKMKSAQFLTMHDSVWIDADRGLEVSCINTCETSGRWTVWICESGPGDRRTFSVYDISANCFSAWRRESSPGPAVTGILRVGTRVWAICQGEKFLYLLSQGLENRFDMSPKECLEAVPTTLMEFKLCKSKNKNELILVGLENGSVASVFRSMCGRTCTITRVELGRATRVTEAGNISDGWESSGGAERNRSSRREVSHPICSICQVGPLCVAVASGEDIHTFQVADDSAALSYNAKISLKSITQEFTPVSSMASEGEKGNCDARTLWCCLEMTPYLVQVDVLKSQILLIIRVSWSLKLDAVRLQEYMPPIPLSRAHAASESDLNAFKKSVPSVHSRRGIVWDEGNTLDSGKNKGRSQTFNEPRYTYTIEEQSDGETLGATGFCGSEQAVAVNNGKVNEALNSASDIPEVTEALNNVRTNTRDIDIKERFDTSRFGSLPSKLDSRPPPLPPRERREEVEVNLNCLAMSQNVLMIGTSCGGLVAIPLIHLGTADGGGRERVIGSSLPLQSDVFRHQQRVSSRVQGEGETRQRMGSSSSTTSTLSCLPVTTPSRQQIPEGEICLLLSAGTRMVSVYSPHGKVRHRSGTLSRGSSSQSGQRHALLIPPTLELPNNTEVSRANNANRDSTNSVFSREDQPDSVASITVWDQVSTQRLEDIELYSTGLN